MAAVPASGQSSRFWLKAATLEVRKCPLRAGKGDIPFKVIAKPSSTPFARQATRLEETRRNLLAHLKRFSVHGRRVSLGDILFLPLAKKCPLLGT